MSDCVGAPRMPVCRENYPFVCSTIKSPDNVPIEFAIENGASVRIVFLNYQSQKHKHQRSRSRQHVFTALLDNGSDHRAGTIILQAEKPARKPGFACITLLSVVRQLARQPQRSVNAMSKSWVILPIRTCARWISPVYRNCVSCPSSRED